MVVYLRVWFLKLSRAGGVGCQACHRRNFNGRYSVVIRSIRILAWLESRMQLQIIAGRDVDLCTRIGLLFQRFMQALPSPSPASAQSPLSLSYESNHPARVISSPKPSQVRRRALRPASSVANLCSSN